MRATLQALYQLQEIDSAVLEIERGADIIPKKIAEIDGSLEALRTELGRLSAEVDQLKQTQRDLEGFGTDETQKLRKWKSRLNEIRNPREYQALSREVEGSEKQLRENDDKILELMRLAEEKQKLVDDKKDVLRQEESLGNAKIRELRETMAKSLADGQKARAGREAVVKRIPERIYKKYEQLRPVKSGIGVSVVVAGTCTACNVRLRPQVVVEVLRGESLEQCSNCNRLLIPDTLVKEQGVVDTGA